MATALVPRPAHRPVTLNHKALVEAVCRRMAKGELVKDAAEAEGTTADQIRVWQATDLELSLLYARAREAQAHALAEQCISLTDQAESGREGNTDKVRLQLDARKWYTSKIAPRLYGDRQAVELSGPDGGPIQQEWTFGVRKIGF